MIRWTVRLILIVMLVFGGLVALTGWSFTQLPTGFVPTEDQGYVFVNVQLPDAASQQRTIRSWKNWTGSVLNTEGWQITFRLLVTRFWADSAASNVGFIAIMFEPWEDRKTPEFSQDVIVQRLQQQLNQVDEAIVVRVHPASD